MTENSEQITYKYDLNGNLTWMYFDGMLVSADKFGNINMAYVGVKVNLPYSVFQNFATTDKDDAFWVQYGINLAEAGR